MAVDVVELFLRIFCWTLIRLLHHWAWLCRGYWRYRNLIDWFIDWSADHLDHHTTEWHSKPENSKTNKNGQIQVWSSLPSKRRYIAQPPRWQGHDWIYGKTRHGQIPDRDSLQGNRDEWMIDLIHFQGSSWGVVSYFPVFRSNIFQCSVVHYKILHTMRTQEGEYSPESWPFWYRAISVNNVAFNCITLFRKPVSL